MEWIDDVVVSDERSQEEDHYGGVEGRFLGLEGQSSGY
jgi:hypothetical protein